ncbi:MAG: hypothetical protein JW776_05140 [Candidatus Lokiarchaeota archaeon]|nr:hypothetical protein [Candidatus Lokiarchaeota archaeon]
MSTVSHTYRDHNGKTIILLPIMHMGEPQYFNKLLEYIGDRICIYEYLELGFSELVQKPTPVKSFDEQLHQSAIAATEFYQQYGQYIKKYQKKIKTRMIRKIRRIVKRNLRVLDERVDLIFQIIERSLYGIQNLTLAQMYLATLVGLSSQLFEIDYITDIPQRGNWIHSDLVYQNSEDSSIGEYLRSIDKEKIENLQKQAMLLYSLVYLIEEFCVTPPSKRKEKFAEWIYISAQKPWTSYEDESPDYLYHPRNEILMNTIIQQLNIRDEVIVLYGTGHMPAIEENLLKKGYELLSKKEFEVFHI